MTFAQLSLIGLVALLGPLLAYRKGWHLPVVLGELVAGIIIGRTGFGLVDTTDPVFTFLADLGFGLVMFVAGTHVPMRDPALRPALRAGAVRAAVVGVVAAALGIAVAQLSGIPHAPVYAVLMASSSAAIILPAIDSLGLGGPHVVGLLPQVAIADTLCIVALPIVIDPANAVRAAAGALAVLATAAVSGLVLWQLERSGIRRRVHRVSEDRKFALELRIQLLVLAAFAALAVATHVSIMLAGFAFGLAVKAVGEPRRLARQLFALTEGFLGPLFFVWLGASLNLREFGAHPEMIWLGVALAAGAAVAHLAGRLLGQPVSMGLLAAAQLGVPVSAATVGAQLGVLRPGEAAAFMLGAIITIAVAVAGGGLAARARMLTVPDGGARLPRSPLPAGDATAPDGEGAPGPPAAGETAPA
ncbi:cation:proton antiporter [Xylanimonas sp. McL0601]|uniref:cation:proton antiporter n=1 Tax=Xylanimonas sp. McL0601 TaxID=3414739 RepID=UPI003CF88107